MSEASIVQVDSDYHGSTYEGWISYKAHDRSWPVWLKVRVQQRRNELSLRVYGCSEHFVGISPSCDGELLPWSKVRVIQEPTSVKVVRLYDDGSKKKLAETEIGSAYLRCAQRSSECKQPYGRAMPTGGQVLVALAVIAAAGALWNFSRKPQLPAIQ